MVPKIKPVDLIKSWRIVKGDLVQVIAGRYRGQQGKVLRVQRDRNSLVVEGINLVGKSLGNFFFHFNRLNDTFQLNSPEQKKEP